jgi:hypothetical protein
MKKIDYPIVQKIKEIKLFNNMYNYNFFFEKMIRDKKQQLLKVKLISINFNNLINLKKNY